MVVALMLGDIVVVKGIEVGIIALAVVIVLDFLAFTASPSIFLVTVGMFAAVGSPFCVLRFIDGVWVTVAVVSGLVAVAGSSCLWSWSSIIKSTEPSPLTISCAAVETVERRNIKCLV